MSLLPNVERELMRVAYASADRPPAGARVRLTGRQGRFGGVALAVAVSVVALMIGAGFLVALHGSGAGRGSGQTGMPPSPPASHQAFPGAPTLSPPRFTRTGLVCARAVHDRYLPRHAGCVSSKLRADMTGASAADLVLIYADLGAHPVHGGFLVKGYTLEVVQPAGAIARMRVPSDPFPWISRVGNINGIAGTELLLHLYDISSGDAYGFYTFQHGRIEAIRPGLSAGGDSADKEGFSCKIAAGGRPVIVARTMILLGPTIYGRWRWTVKTYVFHGTRLFAIGHGSFVRRGLPGRRWMPAGAGCGRVTGESQAKP